MNDLSLYKIDKEIDNILYEGVDEHGEITEETSTKLYRLMLAEKNKIVSCGHWFKHRERQIEQAKEQKKEFDKRIKQEEKKIENLKKLVMQVLEDKHNGKIEDGLYEMKLGKCPASVTISDENKVYAKYWETKEIKTVNKTKVKEALQAGETVNGAFLITTKKRLIVKGE